MPNFESYVQAPSQEKGGSRSLKTQDTREIERKIEQRVAFAQSLIELADILYQQGKIQGRGPEKKRYTPNQLMAIILKVSEDQISEHPTTSWKKQRRLITNAYGIRRAVDRILFDENGRTIVPTFADRLLRLFYNSKEDDEHPERTLRPSEDLPTDSAIYLQQMTKEGFVDAMSRYRPTYRPMTNQQFVMFLMSKMGFPEESLSEEEKAKFARIEQNHQERFSPGFQAPETFQDLIRQLRAHGNRIILSDEVMKAKDTIKINLLTTKMVADRLEQWITGGKTKEGLQDILTMVEARKELKEMIEQLDQKEM